MAATFTLSLDFELIWGTLDRRGPGGFRRLVEVERAEVIGRLLELLAEFEISATWCVVGHLMLESCAPRGGVKHPEIVRPRHAWFPQDWFLHDPGGDERSQPLFFGRSLVERVKACPVPQEIGSHSFSHVIFGDHGCSAATAASELSASVRAAEEMGVHLRSFVFPRNSVGHLDLLAAHGFTSYRGPAPGRRLRSRAATRLGNLWDVLVARTPPVVRPRLQENGLVDVPASLMYFPMHGLRRYIPASRRTRRAIKGLEAAVREGGAAHLWFHPTNLAEPLDAMFAGLRPILAHAARLRQRGELRVATMADLAAAASSIMEQHGSSRPAGH